ncbi:MAG: beta-lactamase family protein [Acidobacteria bacterium]|jgi:CubicO group peptidase (beta-lactamase class C family)|nr:beta-lactamase family protein [Acidobacteriota bacterium]
MKRLTILKRLFVTLFVLGVMLNLSAVAQEQKIESNSALVEPLKVKVDALFAQWDKPDSPGCALGVIKDGNFIYKRGYGMANLDYNIPISPYTSFYIASTSKQFTAASIALLAREGKISLDDDIRKYLPEIPQYQSPVTIRHLVYHTSGIRDYLELTGLAGRHTEDVNTDEDFIKLIARQKNLNFKPGEKYLYSNSGYFLLSQIVKRVSGKSLRVFADENLFKPLGMVNTHFHDDRGEIIKNRATGYFPRKDGFSVLMTNFDRVGDGGLFTSIEDLLLWNQNFYNNKLAGGADLINNLLTTGTLNNGEKTDYAFALIPGDYKGLKMISHGGSFNGFRAEMLRFPEQKFSVICLCNLSSIDATGLATKVADIFLEKQLKQLAKDDGSGAVSESAFLKLSEQELAGVAGLYFNPTAVTHRRVSVKDGKLLFVINANYAIEMKAVSTSRFLMPDIPTKVEISFSPPQPGKVKNMQVVVSGGKPEIFETIKPATYTPEELSKFAGTFYSEELDAKYILNIKENKLIVRFGSEEDPLEALFTDAFASPQGQIIRFKRDQQNRISGFSLSGVRVKEILFNKM